MMKNKPSSDVEITDGDSQRDSSHPWPYFHKGTFEIFGTNYCWKR